MDVQPQTLQSFIVEHIYDYATTEKVGNTLVSMEYYHDLNSSISETTVELLTKYKYIHIVQ